MAIDLRIAAGCGPTGRLLTQLIQQAGCAVRPGGNPVSWGVPMARGLNRNASRLNKYDQLVHMNNAGVRVPFSTTRQVVPIDGVYFARKFRHKGGTDIMPVLQEEDFTARHLAGAEFFTKFIPSQREFRCWIYRRRHLGTYEKVLQYPERYRRIGRNYDNGFVFQLCREDSIPRGAVSAASAAVEAIGLDFGAVDVLLGKDGEFYVLEVNSAPGVEGESRQVIRALASKIARWDALGCPRRNGDRSE